MNILDGIILIILAYALISGFRNGMIRQIFSLAGLIFGIWLGSIFSYKVASLFGLKDSTGAILAFVIIFIITIVVATLLSKALSHSIKFVGLGWIDRILGSALSLCKYLLIMSVAFASFAHANKGYDLVSEKSLKQSMLFYPVASISEMISPVWDEINKQMKGEIKEIKKMSDDLSKIGNTKGK